MLTATVATFLSRCGNALSLVDSQRKCKTVRSPTQPQHVTEIRKRTLLYLLNDDNANKSHDRQQRVRVASRKEMTISGRPHNADCWQSTGINIGNYVFVKESKKFFLGRVVIMRFKDGKKKAERKFP